MTEKDDKFIMMDMNDKRSKKVAEVLGNKTCKAILDYLTYNSEKSEEDIAKALDMKLNTVEYNLKKLLHSGLVDKSKKFFWSKKGKKIPTYSLANKHIVISPKHTKPNLNVLKTIIPIIAAIAVVAIVLALILPGSNNSGTIEEVEGLQNFKSMQELSQFLEDNQVNSGRFGLMEADMASGATSGAKADSAAPASDYSETNIQVQGVDEADIIKNDGKYIYSVSGNKVVIIEAYPAENMRILSEIIPEEGDIGEIFLNEDKLIIFTRDYSHPVLYEARCMNVEGCIIQNEAKTNVYIYDISDKEDPQLEDKISVSGNYVNSRMIDNYIYLITNEYANPEGTLPVIETNNKADIIEATEIAYSPIKDYSFQYTIILAINIDNAETSQETILTGNSQNVYVSQNNIYTTYTKYQQWYEEIVVPETTLINKIAIDQDEINYVGSGEVNGHILNQFSMDEHEGNFRIATTVGEVWGGNSENNLYILNEDMETIGELEGLAPGEKIYSVRFMGERGYIVTFKKVDPLFVLDLSNPEDPNVLGKLKIPGYSDYLHPYDENHIIGIGKDTVEASDDLKEGRGLDFAWYQGVKMALFDVSDVENPIEMYKVVIGDRGTNSEALQNHKAFLFDKKKELLVLPITLAEIEGEPSSDNQYGDYTFQGAYVYNLNLEDGFDLKGRITHYDENEVAEKSGYYFYGSKNVERSLYMDDTLYTFSQEMIKANDLNDLEEINSVDLPYESKYGREPYY